MAMTLTPVDPSHPAECDRCRARAFVETRHNGKPLTWCRHHFTEHQDVLTDHLVVFQSEEWSKEPQPV